MVLKASRATAYASINGQGLNWVWHNAFLGHSAILKDHQEAYYGHSTRLRRRDGRLDDARDAEQAARFRGNEKPVNQRKGSPVVLSGVDTCKDQVVGGKYVEING